MEENNVVVKRKHKINPDSELIYASAVGVGGDSEEIRIILFNKKVISENDDLEMINESNYQLILNKKTARNLEKLLRQYLDWISMGKRILMNLDWEFYFFLYRGNYWQSRHTPIVNICNKLSDIPCKYINKVLKQLYKEEYIRFKNTAHGKDVFLNIKMKKYIENEIKDMLNELTKF